MRVGGGRWAGGHVSVQDKTSVVGVGVQDKCCGCQSAGHLRWVSVCRTSVVGVGVQDMCCGCQCTGQVLWVSVYKTSVVGVGVQDKCCGCQCTGQLCWCQCAGHVLWVSVCMQDMCCGCQCAVLHGCLQSKNVSVARTSCSLQADGEPIWAHGALQDQELNQEPSSCLLFVLVGTFFSLSFLGILG
jgi:hypothetical protein